MRLVKQRLWDRLEATVYKQLYEEGVVGDTYTRIQRNTLSPVGSQCVQIKAPIRQEIRCIWFGS